MQNIITRVIYFYKVSMLLEKDGLYNDTVGDRKALFGGKHVL